MRTLSLALLCVLYALLPLALGRQYDDKEMEQRCATCEGIVEEAQYLLHHPPSTLSLDLRGRVDSKGKRSGKLLAYKGSELLAIEVLEQLCGKLTSYGRTTWLEKSILTRVKARLGAPTNEVDVHSSTVQDGDTQSGFVKQCEELIAEHEDLFTELIIASTEEEKMAKALCYDTPDGACKGQVQADRRNNRQAYLDNLRTWKEDEAKKKKEEAEAKKKAEREERLRKKKEEEEALKKAEAGEPTEGDKPQEGAENMEGASENAEQAHGDSAEGGKDDGTQAGAQEPKQEAPKQEL